MTTLRHVRKWAFLWIGLFIMLFFSINTWAQTTNSMAIQAPQSALGHLWNLLPFRLSTEILGALGLIWQTVKRIEGSQMLQAFIVGVHKGKQYLASTQGQKVVADFESIVSEHHETVGLSEAIQSFADKKQLPVATAPVTTSSGVGMANAAAAAIVLLFLLLAPALNAQTVNTGSLTLNPAPTTTISNPPTVGGALSDLLTAAKLGITNITAIPYTLYAPGLQHKYGGGVAFAYKVNDYVVTSARIDYVNGGFWMPSGSATLQYPFVLASWLTVTPFTYAGIGVPISGAIIGNVTVPGHPPRDNNGQPTAILGWGLALDLPAHFKIIGDQEEWTGFNGKQYRLGVSHPL